MLPIRGSIVALLPRAAGAYPIRGRVGGMALTIAKRTIAAALVGGALVLSTAGACGPTGDDDDAPGVSEQQEGDDDGEDDD